MGFRESPRISENLRESDFSQNPLVKTIKFCALCITEIFLFFQCLQKKKAIHPKRQLLNGSIGLKKFIAVCGVAPLDAFMCKSKDQDTFLKDIVKAFAGSNVPLSKLDPGSPMKKLFEKYIPNIQGM